MQMLPTFIARSVLLLNLMLIRLIPFYRPVGKD